MNSFIRVAFAGLLLLAGQHAMADTGKYPSSPIQMIVPFSPGSGIDVLARIYSEALSKQLNVPVVIMNREGAAGIIGSGVAARSKPDGYTLLVQANPPFTAAPIAQKSNVYDPLKSFTPIARVGAIPLVLVTSAQAPYKTFQALKDYAAANPDKAFASYPGVGSPAQLYMELVKRASGLQVRQVAYKSSTQPMTDIASGLVLTSLISLPAAMPMIQSGKLRAIAVGSKKRVSQLPNVPTIAEVIGQPGFTADVWFGLLAPAGTPKDRVDRIYQAVSKAYATPKVVESMKRAYLVPDLEGPAAFGKSLRVDLANSQDVLSKLDGNK